jgi:glycosyltransferase involved in cell wall biosynthesis
MRIAQLAPPFECVPPARYGGTERVIATLTDELVRRGHEVTLFATAESRTSARLVSIADAALWRRQPPIEDFSPYLTVTQGRILSELELGRYDVLHSHLDFYGFPLARSAAQPVLTTLHNELDLPGRQELYAEYGDVPLVSVSDAQRCPVPDANWMATIYNGIDVDAFTFNPEPGPYLAFLGRISAVKGLDSAIRVAQTAGKPIRIAARPPLPNKTSPEVAHDWQYYEDQVLPLLRWPDVELTGQVAGQQKDSFLGNAAALLFPIRWDEPFGLVMAEALACGTPVIALNRGSVPEVIEDGVTGFICETEEEMVESIFKLGTIDRARCRSEATRRFSPGAMAARYEQVYARLLHPDRADADRLLAGAAQVTRLHTTS